MKKYNELIQDLKKIKKQGFVKTHRSGNTGIGKTLEDLLGIEENNIAGPDGHQTELKSTRKGSSSKITLFTKSPMPKKINTKLLEKFGHPTDNGRKKLHVTISAVSKGSCCNKEGFKINVHDDIIEISHSGYGSMPAPYWERQNLEKNLIESILKTCCMSKQTIEEREKKRSFISMKLG